jgi:hypothetical protein
MGRPKEPRAISVTYDSHNNQLVILCDDGSLWQRVYSHTGGWEWLKVTQFDHKSSPFEPEKIYRETGI